MLLQAGAGTLTYRCMKGRKDFTHSGGREPDAKPGVLACSTAVAAMKIYLLGFYLQRALGPAPAL